MFWWWNYLCLILDVAEIVFDKCIKGSSLPKEHPQYEMTCTYEFLEDTFTDWGPGLYDCMELPTSQTSLNSNNFCARQKQSKVAKLGQKLKLPGYARKHSELKENHPFKFMVKEHVFT